MIGKNFCHNPELLNLKVMKQTFPYLFFLYQLLAFYNSYADCPAFNVTFNNQTEVDNYLPDGGCPVIMGDLTITNGDMENPITSISALRGITQVGGSLIIQSTSLTSLEGLEDLILVTHLWLNDNPNLTSMTGIENLSSAIQVDINQCHSLTNISIGKITNLFALNIVGANSVKDMNGIGGLGSIQYDFLRLQDMLSLESLNGLTNLTDLNGIWLENCPAITDISGLNGLVERLNHIYIVNCSSLSVCNIAPVCNFVKTRSEMGGTVVAFGNGPGCSEEAIIANCQSPLPVTLVRFRGHAAEGEVNLTWATAEETNSWKFQIEHSQNGTVWDAIGSVLANENSYSEKNYQFAHIRPNAKNFYRLKMIDKDNSFAYSSIIQVFTDQAERSFVIYPNPASDYIKFDQKYAVDLTNIQVLSLSGKVLLDQGTITDGKVEIKHLKSGSYLVRARFVDDYETTQRVIVIR